MIILKALFKFSYIAIQKTLSFILLVLGFILQLSLHILFIYLVIVLTRSGLQALFNEYTDYLLEAFLISLLGWLPFFTMTKIGRFIYTAFYWLTAYTYRPYQYVHDDLDFDQVFWRF